MSDMLKKSQKINASEKCVKSDNLTELWKKGELLSGWYYTQLKEGTYAEWQKPVIINYYYEYPSHFEMHNSFVEKVLAPVPSYDEWKHITDCFDYEHNAIIEFQRQIRQIQDLLIRSREFIDTFEDDTDPAGLRARQLNKEIDEVLK